MPLDLNFEDKLLYQREHRQRRDRRTLFVLVKAPSTQSIWSDRFNSLRNLFGFKRSEKCTDSNCVKVGGVARFYTTPQHVVCDQMWSARLGPLLVLVLAKRAHDKGLALLVEGPYTDEARLLFNRALNEPLPYLNVVYQTQSDTFTIMYTPNPGIEVAIAAAIKRLRHHIKMDADNPVHKHHLHTLGEIQSIAEKDFLSKASDAHRK